MKILIVDGQGGGVGRALLEGLHKAGMTSDIVVVGSNATATANMIKGYSVNAATGENAVVYNAQGADIIVGPVGIVMANAMFGEITPAMSVAISSSKAKIILVPMNKCHAFIVGVEEKNRQAYINEAIAEILEASKKA